MLRKSRLNGSRNEKGVGGGDVSELLCQKCSSAEGLMFQDGFVVERVGWSALADLSRLNPFGLHQGEAETNLSSVLNNWEDLSFKDKETSLLQLQDLITVYTILVKDSHDGLKCSG